MKTIYLKYTLIVTLVLSSLTTIAQNESFDWEAKSYLVDINSTSVQIESNIIKQSGIFTWEQVSNLSSNTIEFNITSVTDNWNSQSQTGTINYELTSLDGNASLTLTGFQDEILLTMVLLDDQGQAVKNYVFLIDNLTHL